MSSIFGVIRRDADRFVRRRLLVVLLLVSGASVLSALGPLALKWLVDGFAVGSVHGVAPSVIVGVYATSQFLSRALGDLRQLVYARVERRMFKALSLRLFEQIVRLPLRFHLDRKTGAVGQTLENGLAGYQMILHHLVFTVLPVTAELVTITVVLARSAEPVFLVLFGGTLVCYSGILTCATRAISASAKRASAAHVEAAGRMTDAILNAESIKCFAAEAMIEQQVDRALSRTEAHWVEFYRRFALNGLTVSAIFAVFVAAMTGYAVHEVEVARLTVGDFVLVTAYMLQVFRPVESLGDAVQGLSQGAGLLHQTMSLLGEAVEPRELAEMDRTRSAFRRPESVRVSRFIDGPGHLECDNVTLRYGDVEVLRGVSFIVPAGRTLGIVGASGSGKSTLVRLLVRLLEPESGRILLDGQPLSTYSLGALRRSIAVVPQDPVLFDESIGDNIAFGKPGCSREEVESAAQRARLHEFIVGLPDGYDTNVGERGLKLSGGERQRLAIARAAIKHPRLYLFDEPTSALDGATELAIVANLRELSQSVTTLVITHRLSTVTHADEIIVLDGGRVVEQGTHASLLGQRGLYAASWSLQGAAVSAPGVIGSG